MEEGGSARRVTQRVLDVPDGSEREPSDPAPADPPAPAGPDAAPPPALPPISREPSDLALRERQARWLRERARFEQAQNGTRATAEGSK